MYSVAPEVVSLMLVEDDPGHSRLIQKNLRRAGFANKIQLHTDGQSALDALFTTKHQNESWLVLLDLNLPVLDGYQVLERIKQNEQTQKVPVIILTTTDAPREIERCYALGCNAYISKPIQYEEFTDVIRKLGLFLSVVKLPDKES